MYNSTIIFLLIWSMFWPAGMIVWWIIWEWIWESCYKAKLKENPTNLDVAQYRIDMYKKNVNSMSIEDREKELDYIDSLLK